MSCRVLRALILNRQRASRECECEPIGLVDCALGRWVATCAFALQPTSLHIYNPYNTKQKCSVRVCVCPKCALLCSQSKEVLFYRLYVRYIAVYTHLILIICDDEHSLYYT